MSGPQHLWSGDWEQDSAARAEELAAQRGRAPEIDAQEPEPAAAPPTTRQHRSILAQFREHAARLRNGLATAGRRHARPLRLALLVGILTLCGVGAAYAVSSAVNGGSNSHQEAAQSRSHDPWLGVEMINAPSGGVLISKVIPGSPAQAAGVKPGDVITQIDTEPIAAPAIATAAIDGLQPGDQVAIQLQRGASNFTAHVTLATQPKTYR